MPDKKLFLLDAMALIYRAHFAFIRSPRVNSQGLNTSAVFGFLNTLLEVLEKEKPTHIGVAYDTPEPTFRHIQYVEYKAHRQQQPEDISVAIPYTRRLLEAMHIPILIKPGFEADDVIGTLAHKAAAAGFEVFMMTPDKDFGQLVGEHVYLFKPSSAGKGHEVWGVKEVLERWGITRVEQVTDMLGLIGDASDNIPGIPGIGEKTAQKLIEQYDSVENLIAQADGLSGKIKENVIKFAQQGRLSKQLAVIETQVPIEFEETELLLAEYDKEKLSALLDELEFRTIRQRLFKESAPLPKKEGQMNLFDQDPDKQALLEKQIREIDEVFGGPSAQTIGQSPRIKATPQAEESEPLPTHLASLENTLHRYHLIDTPALRQLLIEHLQAQDEFCFDTETDRLDAVEARVIGLSFAAYPHEAYYVPLPADEEEARQILAEFEGVLQNEGIRKIGQNLKFDLLALKKYGISVRGPLFDTMLADYLVAPDSRHNMNDMAEKYLRYSPQPIESLIGKKGKNQRSLSEVALEEVKEYSAEDADITLQLKQHLLPPIEVNLAKKLFFEVELPLVPVLTEMEYAGVRIDPQALRESSTILETDIAQIEAIIYKYAGESFNIASPKQLGTILFEKLNLDPKARKTASGQYATGEDILSRLADKHDIAAQVLEYRQLQKLKSTYIDALPLLISPRDGRVHTSYNQAVTTTGRLSSTNPNLQNIPVRTDRGREIRKAFVPRDAEHLILSADYSQIELRLMADFSGDPTMRSAFANGLDIHASTASKVFKVALEEVNPELRRRAKMINFGIIYGISAHGLAQRLGLSRTEAADIIKAYFEEFPLVKSYMDTAILEARENGFAVTRMGRRHMLPDIHSNNPTVRGYAERNAINSPLQGTAAEIIKIAMVRIHAWMQAQKLRSRMILQVHDELVFDAHQDEIALLKSQVSEIMRHAMPLEVPMEVGIGVGENWLEAH